MGNTSIKELHRAIMYPPKIDVVRKMLAEEPKLINCQYETNKNDRGEFQNYPFQNVSPLHTATLVGTNLGFHTRVESEVEAATKQYVELISFLLENPECNRNAVTSKSGDTALHFAARAYNLPLVKLLFKHKCLMMVNPNNTPFHEMCRNSGRRMIFISIAHLDPDSELLIDDPKLIPRYEEAERKLLTDLIVEFLAECDDFPRGDSKRVLGLYDGHGRSIVCELAAAGHYTAIGELMTLPGLDINMTNEDANAPINYLLENGQFENEGVLQSLRLLLDQQKFESVEEMQLRRKDYVRKAVQGVCCRRDQKLVEDETKTILYELIVTRKCYDKQEDSAEVLYSLARPQIGKYKGRQRRTFSGLVPLYQWNEIAAERAFGVNGFYTKYLKLQQPESEKDQVN